MRGVSLQMFPYSHQMTSGSFLDSVFWTTERMFCLHLAFGIQPPHKQQGLGIPSNAVRHLQRLASCTARARNHQQQVTHSRCLFTRNLLRAERMVMSRVSSPIPAWHADPCKLWTGDRPGQDQAALGWPSVPGNGGQVVECAAPKDRPLPVQAGRQHSHGAGVRT